MRGWLGRLAFWIVTQSRRILRSLSLLFLPAPQQQQQHTAAEETSELLSSSRRPMGNGSSSSTTDTAAATAAAKTTTAAAAAIAGDCSDDGGGGCEEPVRIRSREGRSRSDAFYGATRPVFNERGEVLLTSSPRASDLPAESSSCLVPASADVSGGSAAAGHIPSARFSVGIADTVGRRPTMEDARCVHGHFGGVAARDLFAVFDGHNGGDASDHANRALPLALAALLGEGAAPEDALKRAFVGVHREIIDNGVRGGTTATAVLFVGDDGWVAHVGDTRLAVLAADGALRRLTVDHRPSNADEAQKVRDRGGFVIAFGGRELRVNGMIAITRALGDRELVDALTAEPDVVQIAPFDWATSTLVLACDGLWDYVSDEEVAAIAHAAPDPQTAAVELRNAAYRKNSTDNITVMIIKPQIPPAAAAQAPAPAAAAATAVDADADAS